MRVALFNDKDGPTLVVPVEGASGNDCHFVLPPDDDARFDAIVIAQSGVVVDGADEIADHVNSLFFHTKCRDVCEGRWFHQADTDD